MYKRLPNFMYNKTVIEEMIRFSSKDFVNKQVQEIIKAYDDFLKSPESVGHKSWEYTFACSHELMEMLNEKIKLHFDKSVFVQIYNVPKSNNCICYINWGSD